ncbi:protein ZBED8-like [Homarus americanus]|uniref:protein ZBED8-like n=1 Tax=Homarus americanus TaxID=6706 RepID=UPI001C45BA89|nr:protein ZBED8-like [Homarus americanus]
MGAEYEVLLYHTEVRWLSRGQILKRLIELRAEVSLFLREKESPLSEQFDSDLKVETWIRNPFLADIDCISDEDLAKDDLIDLKTKEMLRNEFNSKSLGEFWCALTQAYPRLVKRAMGALILFATTYLCTSNNEKFIEVTITECAFDVSLGEPLPPLN